jgi:hypothetical protein
MEWPRKRQISDNSSRTTTTTATYVISKKTNILEILRITRELAALPKLSTYRLHRNLGTRDKEERKT